MQEQTSSNSLGERVPKLRFPEFSESYNSIKLGDITEKVNRTEIPSQAPIMMISAAAGFINQSDKYARDNTGKSLKKYTLLKERELAYNHGASKLKQFGCCFELNLPEARVPYVYHTFSIKHENYTPYLAFLLNNPIIDRQLKKIVSSSVRMDGLLNISYENYMGISINIPKYAEQIKVASFLKLFEKKIELQKKTIEHLKLYKRGLLSKLFPQKDESVPQYRFVGFTDAWEQRKVTELADETYGGGTPKTSIEEYWKGNIPWIQSSDITEHDVNCVNPKKFISEEAVSKSATKLVPENSIAIVTRVGVGKLAIMPFSYTTSQDFLSLSNLKLDVHFTAYLLYKKMQNELHEVQGTSIKGITKEELLNKEVMFPKLDEQHKIGDYFFHLDRLITLHQKKYDFYEKEKLALLQQMFI